MLAGRRTMTKKAPPVVTRHVIWFSWKLVIFFSVVLCVVALLRFHSQPPDDLVSSPTSIYLPRYRISRDNSFPGPPKIAFLFLTRRNLPLDFLWGSFFEVFFFFFSFLTTFLVTFSGKKYDLNYGVTISER